jgi:tRNA(fMet)-specific endonuclease VapC
MSLYILDTDTLSLYQHGHEGISARIRSVERSQLAVTVIRIEEQLSGWYKMLRRARQAPELADAYGRLTKSVEVLSGLKILSFTEAAIERYEQLVKMKLNIGKMDVRVAAIALEQGGIVITRNLRDFQQIPNLPVGNWVE